ncbi:MAG: hypothetical protein HDT29_01135 [Clostridiales bacterium]|nr:hypothetical protein [Clostridiales bacterium]
MLFIYPLKRILARPQRVVWISFYLGRAVASSVLAVHVVTPRPEEQAEGAPLYAVAY